jgi:hypothetical protein
MTKESAKNRVIGEVWIVLESAGYLNKTKIPSKIFIVLISSELLNTEKSFEFTKSLWRL